MRSPVIPGGVGRSGNFAGSLGQVRADHASQAAGVSEQAAGGGQLAGGLAGDGDGQGGAQPGPGGQQRDNAVELQVRGAVGADLKIEPDLSRWFAVWGAPGL